MSKTLICKTLVVWALVELLVSSTSHSISKVGNGSKLVSSQAGFEAELPSNGRYQVVEESGGDIKVVIDAFVGRGGHPGFETQLMFFSELANAFPEWALLDENELKNRLNAGPAKWDSLPNVGCQLRFRSETPSRVNYLAVWGTGRGAFIAVPNQYPANHIAEFLFASIQVLPGYCEWHQP